MIKKLQKKHSEEIAKIHINALNSDFLPSLGLGFLKTFYDGVIAEEDNFGFVEIQDKRVAGFVLGTKDMDGFMKKAIRNNFFKLSFLLLLQVLKKPKIIKNIFETLFYSNKESGPKAELVVIAVSKSKKGKGIGKRLVNTLEKEIKKRKINEYKVGVTKRNKNANEFYKSLGFKEFSTLTLYNKKWNLYFKRFTKKINSKEIAKEYLKDSPFSWALIRTIECELLQDINFKEPVLDVGCGTGFFAKVMLRIMGKTKFNTGLDISKKELIKAKESGVYEKLVNTSVLKMPLPNNSYNTVFSNGVLEHIDGIERALKEIGRVLKKKGRLVFTVPSSYFTKMLFFDFIPGYGKTLNKIFKHHNLFDHKKWQRVLKNSGLKLISFKYYNPRKQIVYHELSMYLAFFSHVSKALFGKWILFKGFRKITLPFLVFFTMKIYSNKTFKTRGGSLLLVAEKI